MMKKGIPKPDFTGFTGTKLCKEELQAFSGLFPERICGTVGLYASIFSAVAWFAVRNETHMLQCAADQGISFKNGSV